MQTYQVSRALPVPFLEWEEEEVVQPPAPSASLPPTLTLPPSQHHIPCRVTLLLFAILSHILVLPPKIGRGQRQDLVRDSDEEKDFPAGHVQNSSGGSPNP